MFGGSDGPTPLAPKSFLRWWGVNAAFRSLIAPRDGEAPLPAVARVFPGSLPHGRATG